MPRTILRRISGLTKGTFFAYLFTQLPKKRKRAANRRRRIVASYDAAAANPEFMAEFAGTHRAFDGTVGDSLDSACPA